MKEIDREHLKILRKKALQVPEVPGVYLHKDGQGEVLYVGKALNLRNRVSSYFVAPAQLLPKTLALVCKIADFDFFVVASEHEALILENNLIKAHRPAYNILLRDDKTYPFLAINPNETWPRVVQTRRRSDERFLYFGPFTNSAQMHRVLFVINRFFMLVKCSPHVFSASKRPCNYYHIGQCMGPCSLPVDKPKYDEMVSMVIDILRGKTDDIIAKLKNKMQESAAIQEYESAARIRDQICALQDLDLTCGSVMSNTANLDVIGVARHRLLTVFCVTQTRNGLLVGTNYFIVRDGLEEPPDVDGSSQMDGEPKILTTFLCQFYATHEIPPLIVVPDIRAEIWARVAVAVEKYLATISNLAPQLLASSKISGKEKTLHGLQRSDVVSLRLLIKMTLDNGFRRLQDELKIDQTSQEMMEALKSFIGLVQLPVQIECFDVSTFQGVETVASRVVFRDGKPAKSDYRRYLIKEHLGQDDFASLREVMRRRFRSPEVHDLPSLVLVDGGEPQVREVLLIMNSLGLTNVPLIGIAKARTEAAFAASTVSSSQERLVIPVRRGSSTDPLDVYFETRVLREGSPEWRLVVRIRDEAHRFAIEFHRKRRDARSHRSILQEVPGLGPKRRRDLLAVFSDVDTLRKASLEELQERGHLPEKIARKLMEVLESAKT